MRMDLTCLGALTLTLAAATPPSGIAASGCATNAMLVFDGSVSMADVGFDPTAPTRIDEARAAGSRAMPQITPVRRLGLLLYGPGPEGSCHGINLHFGPLPDAAEVLDYRHQPGIVVLVTDGNETCGGRPCATGKELAIAARDLAIHVIGFRVVADPFAWDSPEAGVYSDGASVAKCLSDGTGGSYVSTETVDERAEALRETLGCALIGMNN